MARAAYDVGSTITSGFFQGVAEIPGAFYDAFTIGGPAAWEALEEPRQLPDAIADSFSPETIPGKIFKKAAHGLGSLAMEAPYMGYYDPVDFGISTVETISKGLKEDWGWKETRSVIEATDIAIQGKGWKTMAADLAAGVSTTFTIAESNVSLANKRKALGLNAIGIIPGFTGYLPKPLNEYGLELDVFVAGRIHVLLQDEAKNP